MSFLPDTILLKIRRDFTENEALAFLQAELSRARFRIGELTAELAEIQHELQLVQAELALAKEENASLAQTVETLQQKPQKPVLTKQDIKDEKLQQMRQNVRAALRRKQYYQQEFKKWQNRYFDLKIKAERAGMQLETTSSGSGS